MGNDFMIFCNNDGILPTNKNVKNSWDKHTKLQQEQNGQESLNSGLGNAA